MLRLPDHWLWDFWFARDGDDVHVFYLQAPRSLGDPDLRHRNATVGHAVSRDLRKWRVLAGALGPGPPGEFDDIATWTGSVVRHGDGWAMLYTGISSADDGAAQRIGLATSDDLVRWERQGLVLEADERWYARADWRDPWIDVEDGRFHALITASARDCPPDGRGVIAHAVSGDLRSWEVLPPVSEPGELAELEVPQLVHLGGAWRMLFCAQEHDHSAARRARGVRPQTGTHYLTARDRFGPYAMSTDEFLDTRHYAGRVLEHRGAWWFLGWRDFALSDPQPLVVAPDGSLRVAAP